MVIRNSLKILWQRFSLSWVLTLFLSVIALVVLAISLSFIVPALFAFRDAGLRKQADAIILIIFETGDLTYFGAQASELWTSTMNVFRYMQGLTMLTLVMFIICVVIFRFLIGFYEIPLLKILEGNLSFNAKLGFGNRLVASIITSAKFVPIKFAFTLIYDIVFLGGLYLLFQLFFIPQILGLVPILILAYLVFGLAFRNTLIVFWAPKIVMGNKGIIESFSYGIKKSFKHFKSVFFTFVIIWAIVLGMNLFLAVFTFGFSLLATIPISMLLLNIVSMVLYYSHTGRRFWLGDKIVTPKHPRAEAITAKEDM